MAKSNPKIAKNLGGNKKNLLAQILKGTDLDKTFIVPLEIAKRSHKALVADYFGTLIKEPFEFQNSQEGVAFLHRTLSDLTVKHQAKQTILAFEATGHYYQNAADQLFQLGYRNLFLLNPLATSQCRKAGLTWSKTDNIDLAAIGQALISGYANPYRPRLADWEDLREYSRLRRFYVKCETALKNKIHTHLDRLLPGIADLNLFKDSYLFHPASLDFLAAYPNVQAIARLNPRAVVAFFRRRGRRLSSEDPYQLLAWTKKTFALDDRLALSTQKNLQSLLARLRDLQKELAQLEIEILVSLVKTPALLLLTLDWIGPLRAAEFAGESAPLDQYPKSRALIKAAGLDSTRFQSGPRQSAKRPVSKKGSIPLRYISLQIGQALMNHNDHFAASAQRFFDRGNSKGYACIATTCRFLRIAFSMLKDQQPFRPASGLGISPNPLAKIESFLKERKASDRIEPSLNLAQKYLQPFLSKEVS